MATHKAPSDTPTENNQTEPLAATVRPKCGIIMPIAGFGTYTEGHWNDILRTIKKAADIAGFDASMVSTGADVGVIHANIINNIYSNEMVVCDVSGKNANVMFELGLRLASKLPVIIIKDELTGYSFDTSPIQHLSYRSDLRLYETLAFQEDLALQIRNTYESSQKPGYKTFLDHFGSYTLAKVEDKAIDLSEFMEQIFSRLESIEQRQTVNQAGSNNKTNTLEQDTLVERFQRNIQDKVNALIGSRPIDNSRDYARIKGEIIDMVGRTFAIDISLIKPEIVDEAIKLAIKQCVGTRQYSKHHGAGTR